MGRRAHLIQMALGQSAFEPLARDFTEENSDPALLDDHCQPKESIAQDGAKNFETAGETSSSRPFTFLVDTPLYQQQYDSRGYPKHPASRELSRLARRAMNDVLATIGVVVGSQKEPQTLSLDKRTKPVFDRARLDDVKTENSIGLLVDFADRGLMSISRIVAAGFRHRLQTFRYYSGISLVQILTQEREYFGLLRIVMLGVPASSLFTILGAAKGWALKRLGIKLVLHFSRYIKRPEDYDFLALLAGSAMTSLDILISALLAPLAMFAELQRLGLLPGWPWLSHPRAFIPFSASSPLQIPTLPAIWTLGSSMSYAASFATSHLFLRWILSRTKPLVARKLYAYLQAALPKPYRPCRYSLEAAKEDQLDISYVPGICNDPNGDEDDWESASFLEELAKDLQYIGYGFQILCNRCTGLLSKNTMETSNDPANHRDSEANNHPVALLTEETSPSILASSPNVRISSSLNSHPPTPPISLELSPHGDDGTVQLNISYPIPNPDQELNSSIRNPGNIGGGTKKLNDSVQRITALTAYAANSMAHHLSLHLADFLCLPLEALFVRSLATSFLSSPRSDPIAQAAAARWRGEVFPLSGWCGLGRQGGWRGMCDYAGKMVLVSGMEMGVNLAIWQLCTGLAWWSGRGWFGWGRL